MECCQKFYIHNFKIGSCDKFNESILVKGSSVYEVIRIGQGVALFLEDHLNRLFYSADLLNYSIKESYCDIELLINELIRKNNTPEGKIKLVVRFEKENGHNEKDLILYFTPHYFPECEEYKNGVKTGLCNVTRLNPNAKLLNSEARKRANNRIVEEKLFEVLLVNENGYITEGSRSNLFFIKNNKVITPPEKDVLNGITRKIILRICKHNNIEICEKEVSKSEIESMDAIFLTGTSIKALPISQIENIYFSSKHPILNQIMGLYDKSMEEFIKSKS